MNCVDAGADVRVGDKRVNNASPEGTKAQVSVGKGEKAFVMRMKEFHEEDQAAKAAEIDRLEQTMKQKASGNADYGSLQISRGS